MVNANDTFVPSNMHLKASNIAEELFEYYGECSKVGEELPDSAALLNLLTPELVQAHVDNMYGIDESMDESDQDEALCQIHLDLLTGLGLVDGI